MDVAFLLGGLMGDEDVYAAPAWHIDGEGKPLFH